MGEEDGRHPSLGMAVVTDQDCVVTVGQGLGLVAGERIASLDAEESGVTPADMRPSFLLFLTPGLEDVKKRLNLLNVSFLEKLDLQAVNMVGDVHDRGDLLAQILRQGGQVQRSGGQSIG